MLNCQLLHDHLLNSDEEGEVVLVLIGIFAVMYAFFTFLLWCGWDTVKNT